MSFDAATSAQHDAAEPGVSTWLSANAGSGKTRVLTDRVARLLLSGADPANILCLTYTRAAAGEMQNRLFKGLGGWAMKGDAALAEALAALGEGRARSRTELAQARTLFARAVEVPGGLRIQTIHSFCAALLRRFPLEAGVGPGFAEMEEREAELLREEVLQRMAGGPERAAIDGLARHLSGDDTAKLLETIARNSGSFSHPLDAEALKAVHGVPAGEGWPEVLGGILTAGCATNAAEAIAAFAAGSANDIKLADALARIDWQALTPAGLEALEGCLLTGDAAKVPYGSKAGKQPTKSTRNTHSGLAEWLDDLSDRVEAARPRRLALAGYERSLALHAFARPFCQRLEAEKAARGLLGFDDLINRAGALLSDPKVADWVLWRLDGGIDHILVDEAQDTSPGQWKIIELLAREIAAGEGRAAAGARTIFVVGDPKQSIYSFQGADPAGFGRMRRYFSERLGPAGLQDGALLHSFRSANAVLQVVDATFNLPEAEPEMPGEAVPLPRAELLPHRSEHIAFKTELPGRVDLWPLLPKPDKDEAPPFADLTDPQGLKSAEAVLAEDLARQVRAMVGAALLPDGEGGGRPVSEGDILILVRRRSPVYHEVIAALKRGGLNIAGKDRLKLGAELAVRDIGAVIRFVALAEDELSLAAALRSPLFGWSEAALHGLAQGRKGRLWQTLRAARDQHPETLALIDDLRRHAEFLRPYDLIMRLLTEHDGRARLLARLGPEAEDGIDSLLAQALAYEQSEIPSLTGFAEWMQAEDQEVKRQLGRAEGRIRVMTVHGAKGLESPIVILPDCGPRRAPSGGLLLHKGGLPLWPGTKDELPPALTDLRDAEREASEAEDKRLLYVAMTRAESWLIVAGIGKQEEPSWHQLVMAGMERQQVGSVSLDCPTGPGLRHEQGSWPSAATSPMASTVSPSAEIEPEPFATFGPVAAPPAGQPWRSPSDLGGAKVMPGDASEGDAEAAMARGRLLHLLLEHLPALPLADRAATGQALVEASDDVWLVPDAGALVGEAMALIAAPHLAPLFAPGALAEAEIAAPLAGFGPAPFFGVLDLLWVSDSEVHAIDFKSNRLVPAHPDEVPEGLLRQMAAYGAMLAEVFPGRAMRLSLLWTAEARLMELPTSLLAEALARAAASSRSRPLT